MSVNESGRIIQRRAGIVVIVGVLLIAGLVALALSLSGGPKGEAAANEPSVSDTDPVVELTDPSPTDAASESASPDSSEPASAEPSESATPSSTPSPSSKATTPAATSTIAPGVPPLGVDAAAPVPFDESAESARDVEISLKDTKAVKAVGEGIGEVSGPAVAVTVQVDNGTGKPVSLANASVSAYYGSAGVPASPVSSDKSYKAFASSVDAGKSTTGTFIFRIPEDQRQNFTVVVLVDTTSKAVTFTGSM